MAPHTVGDVLQNAFEACPPPENFAELSDAMQTVGASMPKRHSLVLVFDEFEGMPSATAKDALKWVYTLHSNYHTNKQGSPFRVVIFTSRDLSMWRLDDHSPFSIAQTIEIPPFSREEFGALLDMEHVGREIHPLCFDDEARVMIFEEAGGRPRFLQYLCHLSLEALPPGQETVTKWHVYRATARVFEDGDGGLSRICDPLSGESEDNKESVRICQEVLRGLKIPFQRLDRNMRELAETDVLMKADSRSCAIRMRLVERHLLNLWFRDLVPGSAEASSDAMDSFLLRLSSVQRILCSEPLRSRLGRELAEAEADAWPVAAMERQRALGAARKAIDVEMQAGNLAIDTDEISWWLGTHGVLPDSHEDVWHRISVLLLRTEPARQRRGSLPGERALRRTSLKLVKMEIKNIRCFERLVVSFQDRDASPRQWTMILGDNATGKTALLRSIAIGLCNEGDGTALMRELPGDMLRKGGPDDGSIELTLAREGSEDKYVVTTEITRTRSPDAEKLRKKMKPAKEFPWKDIFVCGYGTHRSGTAEVSHERYSALTALLPLFDPDAQLQNPEVVLLKAGDQYEDLKETLLRALMLDEDGGSLSRPRVPQEKVELRGPWGTLPIDTLSDGYRSTAQWLLDFLGWAIYAGRLDAGQGVGGILLIDELEQHLHPKWQRHIVQRLAEKLPKTQIVATTHTPLVAAAVGDVPSSAILKLPGVHEGRVCDDDLIDGHGYLGMRADQILTELFDLVTSRTIGSEDDMARYAELSSRDRTAEEKEEFQRLAKKLEEGLAFGESRYERDVEKAVRKVLKEQLMSPPSELMILETRRQLRDPLGD